MYHKHKCRVQTIKFLEDNIRVNLCDPGSDNGFLGKIKSTVTKKNR